MKQSNGWKRETVNNLLRLAKLGVQNAEFKTQLNKLYQDLKEGKIPEKILYTTLHIFGESDYKRAEDAVSSHLTHDDPQLRKIAIHVLTNHWKNSKYKEKIIDLISNDPDEDVRAEAALGLGNLEEGSNDKKIKHLLKDVMHKEKLFYVQKNCYWAILKIKGINSSEIHRIIRDANDKSDLDLNIID